MYVFLSGNLFENKTNQPNKKNALNLIKRSPSVTSTPRFPLRKTAANLTSFTPSKGVFVSPPPSAEDEQDDAEVQSSYRPVQHPAASKPLCEPLGSLPRLSSQDRIFPLRSPQVFASRPHAAHGAFFFLKPVPMRPLHSLSSGIMTECNSVNSKSSPGRRPLTSPELGDERRQPDLRQAAEPSE